MKSSWEVGVHEGLSGPRTTTVSIGYNSGAVDTMHKGREARKRKRL